jgi:hypothetical protein
MNIFQTACHAGGRGPLRKANTAKLAFMALKTFDAEDFEGFESLRLSARRECLSLSGGKAKALMVVAKAGLEARADGRAMKGLASSRRQA